MEQTIGLKEKFRGKIQTLSRSIGTATSNMIGAMEKGIEKAQIATPPKGSYQGVDLTVLPKYICFKAALIKEKITAQYFVLIVTSILLVQYGVSRYEISSLNKKLREKEYILAPGVKSFTPASAQTVTDEYVESAVRDMINKLGDIDPVTIDAQYNDLEKFMSPDLKVRFRGDTVSWKQEIKNENISETLVPTDTEIIPDGKGSYKVTSLVKRDTYINNEHAGSMDEVIEMVLQLMPPKDGIDWFLQINSLTRSASETFKAKNRISGVQNE